MPKGLFASILFASLAFAGCDKFTKGTDPWANCWKVTSIEATDTLSADTVFDIVKFRTNEGYLRLYKGGKYVLFSKQGSAQGTWVLDDAEKHLKLENFAQGFSANFEILSNENAWLSLQPVSVGKVVAKQKSNLLLKVDPYFEHEDLDLMQPDRNAWRIKPTHAESKQEIKKKVAAHLQYMIDYFQFTEDNGQGFFETWQLQTPYRFYSNGMSIENLDDEKPQHWRQWFYNEADAEQGHRLMAQALMSINKYPANTKTFTEGYILALKEMKEFVDRK